VTSACLFRAETVKVGWAASASLGGYMGVGIG